MHLLFKLGLLKSLKSVSVVCDTKYKIMRDPNDEFNIDWLANLNIDLVVSFSAPCVFKTELLSLPKYGRATFIAHFFLSMLVYCLVFGLYMKKRIALERQFTKWMIRLIMVRS